MAQAGVAPLAPLALEGVQQEEEVHQTTPIAGQAASSMGIAPTSMMQRAKGPFVGATVLAVAAAAGWQTKRLYKVRQETLVNDFAATMLARLGDTREMEAAFASFRKDLGPGKFKNKMFIKFVVEFAKTQPIGVPSIESLRATVDMMKLGTKECASLYEEVAAELKEQPSVLGKLVFTAERATPEAAAAATLRGKITGWSAETTDLLQKERARSGPSPNIQYTYKPSPPSP